VGFEDDMVVLLLSVHLMLNVIAVLIDQHHLVKAVAVHVVGVLPLPHQQQHPVRLKAGLDMLVEPVHEIVAGLSGLHHRLVVHVVAHNHIKAVAEERTALTERLPRRLLLRDGPATVLHHLECFRGPTLTGLARRFETAVVHHQGSLSVDGDTQPDVVVGSFDGERLLKGATKVDEIVFGVALRVGDDHASDGAVAYRQPSVLNQREVGRLAGTWGAVDNDVLFLVGLKVGDDVLGCHRLPRHNLRPEVPLGEVADVMPSPLGLITQVVVLDGLRRLGVLTQGTPTLAAVRDALRQLRHMVLGERIRHTSRAGSRRQRLALLHQHHELLLLRSTDRRGQPSSP
jgi:hypothetical protein